MSIPISISLQTLLYIYEATCVMNYIWIGFACSRIYRWHRWIISFCWIQKIFNVKKNNKKENWGFLLFFFCTVCKTKRKMCSDDKYKSFHYPQNIRGYFASYILHYVMHYMGKKNLKDFSLYYIKLEE